MELIASVLTSLGLVVLSFLTVGKRLLHRHIGRGFCSACHAPLWSKFDSWGTRCFDCEDALLRNGQIGKVK